MARGTHQTLTLSKVDSRGDMARGTHQTLTLSKVDSRAHHKICSRCPPGG